MSAPYRVHITSEALADYAVALEWWAANRDKAPDALEVEVTAALRRLEQYGPKLGTPARGPGASPGWRRLHLKRVRYYLYFTMTPEGEVDVLALWGTARRDHPQI